MKEWKLDGNAVNGTNPSYTHTITQAVNVTVSFEPKKALLTLEAGKNTVKVKAKTADGSAIKVEGCNETTLASEAETTLTAKVAGTQIALIGDITELNCRGEEMPGGNRPLASLDASGLTALQELYCNTNQIPELNVHDLTKLQKLDCRSNKLTSLNVQGLTKLQQLNCSGNQLSTLNVQGCTSLKELLCYQNKLNADAFIRIFNDLPEHQTSDGATAVLYADRAGGTEDNCKDFNTPAELKTAFENAKNIKHWKMKKRGELGLEQDI